jgi:nicotinate-nucleotide adenylyltransferase
MKRIGLLGGAFDPIHTGHLMMAEAAADAFGLDQVIFVVAHQSPFKGKAASPKHRLAMVKAAVKGNARFAVSDVELKRKGVSYTIDTVGSYKHHNPDTEVFLIIGQDNVAGLSRWKHIDILRKMAHFVVIERDWFDVSSTLIRHKVSQKKSARYLTTDSVIRYIKQHRLYT